MRFDLIIDISFHGSGTESWIVDFIDNFINLSFGEFGQLHLIVFFPSSEEGFDLLVEDVCEVCFGKRSKDDFVIDSIGEFWG